MDEPAVGSVPGACLQVVPRWGPVQAHCSLLLRADKQGQRDVLQRRHAEKRRTEWTGDGQQQQQHDHRREPPHERVRRTTALLRAEGPLDG